MYQQLLLLYKYASHRRRLSLQSLFMTMNNAISVQVLDCGRNPSVVDSVSVDRGGRVDCVDPPPPLQTLFGFT